MSDLLEPQEYVLLAIPRDLLIEADIDEGDVLRIFVENGRLLIEPKFDDDEFSCCDDCENCPLADECAESEVE